MNRISTLAVVAVALGALAACGRSTTADQPATITTTSPTPVTMRLPDGWITSANAPAASAGALARMQASPSGEIPPDALNLIALVDQAAHANDIQALVHLSGCGEFGQPGNEISCDGTRAKWSNPQNVAALITLLERAHPAATDGWTYPGFNLGPGPDDAADLALLGVRSPSDYTGLITSFRRSSEGEHLTFWDGYAF
jgi:hypothetical protein